MAQPLVSVQELQTSFREARERRAQFFESLGHADEAARVRSMPVPAFDCAYFAFVRRWIARNQ